MVNIFRQFVNLILFSDSLIKKKSKTNVTVALQRQMSQLLGDKNSPP